MDDHEPSGGSGAVEEYGSEPQEVAGPDDCHAQNTECQVAIGDLLTGAPHDSSFQADDELHESLRVEPIQVSEGPDGLPQFADQQLQFAPPFGYDTVVCIEDDRVFVELFHEELHARSWEHHGAWMTPEGTPIVGMHVRSRYDDVGADVTRDEFPPEAVSKAFGHMFVRRLDDPRPVPVRPARERCAHYRRLNAINDDQPDTTQEGSRIMFRWCSALRSNGGAYMSLRDEAVFACDLRLPHDATSAEKFLDSSDRGAIKNKLHLKLIPAWGRGEDDDDAREESPRAMGIFGT